MEPPKKALPPIPKTQEMEVTPSVDDSGLIELPRTPPPMLITEKPKEETISMKPPTSDSKSIEVPKEAPPPIPGTSEMEVKPSSPIKEIISMEPPKGAPPPIPGTQKSKEETKTIEPPKGAPPPIPVKKKPLIEIDDEENSYFPSFKPLEVSNQFETLTTIDENNKEKMDEESVEDNQEIHQIDGDKNEIMNEESEDSQVIVNEESSQLVEEIREIEKENIQNEENIFENATRLEEHFVPQHLDENKTHVEEEKQEVDEQEVENEMKNSESDDEEVDEEDDEDLKKVGNDEENVGEQEEENESKDCKSDDSEDEDEEEEVGNDEKNEPVFGEDFMGQYALRSLKNFNIDDEFKVRDSLDLSPTVEYNPQEFNPITFDEDNNELTVITEITTNEPSPTYGRPPFTPRNTLDTDEDTDTEPVTPSIFGMENETQLSIREQLNKFVNNTASSPTSKFRSKVKYLVRVDDHVLHYMSNFKTNLNKPVKNVKLGLSKKNKKYIKINCKSQSVFIKNFMLIESCLTSIKESQIYLKVPIELVHLYLKYIPIKIREKVKNKKLPEAILYKYSSIAPGEVCINVIGTESYINQVNNYCTDGLLLDINIVQKKVERVRLERLMQNTHPRKEDLAYLSIPFTGKKNLIAHFNRQFSVDLTYSYNPPSANFSKVEEDEKYAHFYFFESKEKDINSCMTSLELYMADEDDRDFLKPNVEFMYYLFEAYPNKFKFTAKLKRRLVIYQPRSRTGVQFKGPSKFVELYNDMFNNMRDNFLKKNLTIKKKTKQYTRSQIHLFNEEVYPKLIKEGVNLEYVNLDETKFHNIHENLNARLSKCRDLDKSFHFQIYKTISQPFPYTAEWKYLKDQQNWVALPMDIQEIMESTYLHDHDKVTSKIKSKKSLFKKQKEYAYDFHNKIITIKNRDPVSLARIVNTRRQWARIDSFYGAYPYDDDINRVINENYPRSFKTILNGSNYFFDFTKMPHVLTINNSEEQFKMITPPGVQHLTTTTSKNKSKRKKKKEMKNLISLEANRSPFVFKVHYYKKEQLTKVNKIIRQFEKDNKIKNNVKMDPEYIPHQMTELSKLSIVDFNINTKDGNVEIIGDRESIDLAMSSIVNYNRFLREYPKSDPRRTQNSSFNPDLQGDQIHMPTPVTYVYTGEPVSVEPIAPES